MKRVLTALALIPAVLYAVLTAPWWAVLILVAAAAALCYREFAAMAQAFGVVRQGPFGLAAGLVLLAVPGDGLLIATLLAMTGIALAMNSGDLQEVLPRAGTLALGLLYIFGGWKCALLLHRVSPYWLLYALVINWVGDISAYYVGKNIGIHKLAREISPGKSWEGAIASVVASMAFGAIFLPRFIPGVDIVHALALSAVVNPAGQLGDLAESALKRGAGVKDSGNLLPGHGGMLDRVDSTLFAMPVVYLYLRLS
ncbi:MAG: phosphatidate cytidylyltransferase [Bryobacteraceae bacterium]